MNQRVGRAVLFALRREAAPFTRGLRRLTTVPGAPCPTVMYEAAGDPLLVLETGVGAVRAGVAATWLLDQYEPRLVVAAGFAGALSPTLAAGDVMVASEVIEPDDLTWRVALPVELGDLPCGRLFTSAHLVSTPAAKAALHSETRALAVDMESGAIAEACQARRVPCACVRAVSDAAADGLSTDLVRLMDGGAVSARRVLAAVARRPRLVGEMLRLERTTRRAARNLATSLRRLLDGR